MVWVDDVEDNDDNDIDLSLEDDVINYLFLFIVSYSWTYLLYD